MPEEDEPKQVVPTLLGRRVRALRKARGLSQKQLSKSLKIAQGSVSDIETGVIREVSGKVLAGLCRTLRAMPDFFVSEEEQTTDFGELVIAQQEAIFLIGSMKPETREAAIGALRGMSGAAASEAKPFGNQVPPAATGAAKTAKEKKFAAFNLAEEAKAEAAAKKEAK